MHALLESRIPALSIQRSPYFRKSSIRSLCCAAIFLFGAEHSSIANQSTPVAKRSPAQQSRLDEASELHTQVIKLIEQGKPKEALPLAERSLAIRQEILGQWQAVTGSSLNNLGMIHQELGAYAKSKHYLEQALAVWTKVKGPDDTETANAFNNLGLLCILQGEHAEAHAMLKRALAVRIKALGEKNAAHGRVLQQPRHAVRCRRRLPCGARVPRAHPGHPTRGLRGEARRYRNFAQ